MTPLQYFRQLAKEFDNLTDTDADALITTAGLFCTVDGLEAEQQNAAKALYAAHLCWIEKFQSNAGGLRGAVVSEREDKQSRTYAQLNDSETFIGQSSYGQQYLQLVAPLTVGMITRYS